MGMAPLTPIKISLSLLNNSNECCRRVLVAARYSPLYHRHIRQTFAELVDAHSCTIEIMLCPKIGVG